AAQRTLAHGNIVAIKGIGGYHLGCAVSHNSAVAELRRRKARRGKPFAVLVRDLEVALRYAEISDGEAAVLSSPARPIVLLRRRSDAPLAPGVAPASPWVRPVLPDS